MFTFILCLYFCIFVFINNSVDTTTTTTTSNQNSPSKTIINKLPPKNPIPNPNPILPLVPDGQMHHQIGQSGMQPLPPGFPVNPNLNGNPNPNPNPNNGNANANANGDDNPNVAKIANANVIPPNGNSNAAANGADNPNPNSNAPGKGGNVNDDAEAMIPNPNINQGMFNNWIGNIPPMLGQPETEEEQEPKVLYHTYETALLQQRIKSFNTNEYQQYTKKYIKIIEQVRDVYSLKFHTKQDGDSGIGSGNGSGNMIGSFDVVNDLPQLIAQNIDSIHENSMYKFILLRITSNHVTIFVNDAIILNQTQIDQHSQGAEKFCNNENNDFKYMLSDNHCSATIFEMKKLFQPAFTKMMQKLSNLENQLQFQNNDKNSKNNKNSEKLSVLAAINCFSCANDVNNERTQWLSHLSQNSNILSYCMTREYLSNINKYHSILIPRFYTDPKSFFIDENNETQCRYDPPTKTEVLKSSNVDTNRFEEYMIDQWKDHLEEFAKNKQIQDEEISNSFLSLGIGDTIAVLFGFKETPEMILDKARIQLSDQFKRHSKKSKKSNKLIATNTKISKISMQHDNPKSKSAKLYMSSLYQDDSDFVVSLRYPWHLRSNKAVFGGRLTHPWRYQLWKLFTDYDELFELSDKYMQIDITSAYHIDHPVLSNVLLTHENKMEIFDKFAQNFAFTRNFPNAKAWYDQSKQTASIKAKEDLHPLLQKFDFSNDDISQFEIEEMYMEYIKDLQHNQESSGTYAQTFIKFDQQIEKYKYVIHIDGWSCAARLAKYMTAGFVVLWLQDNIYYPEKQYVEHWYDDLVPYKHYIPIQWGSSSYDDALFYNYSRYLRSDGKDSGDGVSVGVGDDDNEFVVLREKYDFDEIKLNQLFESNKKIWITEKLGNLIEAIKYLQMNDTFAREIALNAQIAMKNEFTKNKINDFVYDVLDTIEITEKNDDGIEKLLQQSEEIRDSWNLLPLENLYMM